MVDVYQVVLGAIAVSIMVLVPIGLVLLYDLLADGGTAQLLGGENLAGSRLSAGETCARCAINVEFRWSRWRRISVGCARC